MMKSELSSQTQVHATSVLWGTLCAQVWQGVSAATGAAQRPRSLRSPAGGVPRGARGPRLRNLLNLSTRAGRDAGWAGHVPHGHVPHRPSRRGAQRLAGGRTGCAEALADRDPGRPTYARKKE